jgi:hypothetical protein
LAVGVGIDVAFDWPGVTVDALTDLLRQTVENALKVVFACSCAGNLLQATEQFLSVSARAANEKAIAQLKLNTFMALFLDIDSRPHCTID